MSRSSPPLAYAPSGASVRAQEPRSALRERIAELTKRLRTEHDEYEQAAQSWTEEAAERKRDARRAREGTLHEIERLLARAGEGDVPANLERLPFARKLAELEAWIQSMPAVQEKRAPPRQEPISEVVSVSAVVTVAAAPERQVAESASTAAERAIGSALASATVAVAEPVSATISPSGTVAAHAAILAGQAKPPAVERPRLPALHLATRDTRSRDAESTTVRVVRIAAALAALALVVGAWRSAHRRSPANIDETLPLADHTPETVVALASASHDRAAGAEPSPCAPTDTPSCPCADRPTNPSATKRASVPQVRAPQPRPRVTWPSPARASR